MYKSKFKPKTFPIANIVNVGNAVSTIRQELREGPQIKHTCLIDQVGLRVGIIVPNCTTIVDKECIVCDKCDKLIDSWFTIVPASCAHCSHPLYRDSNHLAHDECMCIICNNFYNNVMVPSFYTFINCLKRLGIYPAKDVLKIIFNIMKFDHVIFGCRRKYVHFSKIDNKQLATLIELYPGTNCPSEFIECTELNKSDNCLKYVPKFNEKGTSPFYCGCNVLGFKSEKIHLYNCSYESTDRYQKMSGKCNACYNKDKCKNYKSCHKLKITDPLYSHLGLCDNCSKFLKCTICDTKTIVPKTKDNNFFTCDTCLSKGICCHSCRKIYRRDSIMTFEFTNGFWSPNGHTYCTFCTWAHVQKNPNFCNGRYSAFLLLYFSKKHISKLDQYVFKVASPQINQMKCIDIFEKIMFRLSLERGTNKKGFYRDLEHNFIGKNKKQLIDYYHSLKEYSDIDWYLLVLRLPAKPFNIILHYLIQYSKKY